MRALARSLICRLPRSLLYEAFYQTGSALGVTAYEVEGDESRFVGPLYDQVIIRTYLTQRAWCPELVALFQDHFVPDGGVFYDIGANIGLTAIPLARNPAVAVTAFEPDPHNGALLRANAATADVALTVVRAAVADRPGVMGFDRDPWNAGDHRLSASGRTQVPTVRLDDHPPPPGRRFAVKIDTQGAEPLIFAGGARVLAQAGLIVSEFWPGGMRRLGVSPDSIFAFVGESGFAVGALLAQNQRPGEWQPIPMVLERLRAFADERSDLAYRDLVLRR